MIDDCARDGKHVRSHRRSMIYARRYLFVSLLALAHFVRVTATWIDPDTPKSAYKTRPLHVPRDKGGNRKGNSTGSSKKKHHTSKKPTPSPSNAPSDFPTATPTLSPTDKENKEPVEYTLVMSDEFNVAGRTFEDGSDPRWTALDKNDYTNNALHYYSASNAFTNDDGDLIIKSEPDEIEFIGFDEDEKQNKIDKKYFRSAMMQSWNKFCFTGGIIEAEVELPGKHDVSGLWPAFWLLGNMARHTYIGSTNHVWPWSSLICTEKTKDAQKINGCLNTLHYGLHPNAGRGSPEIDVFEVQPGPTPGNTGIFLRSFVGQPFLSASYQVAPGRPVRPWDGHWPGPGQWYDGLQSGLNTSLNIYFFGTYNHVLNDNNAKDYWSDAVSFNHQLVEDHFTTKKKYRVEWEPPDDETGSDGYIRWFVDDKFVSQINGTGIVDAGHGATVSSEPMYIIMNTAISKEWGFSKCPSNCPCKIYNCQSKIFSETCGFPTGFCDMMNNKTEAPEYKVNYVRVYQNSHNSKHKVGCSTPERPTKRYIEGHEHLYKNKNDHKPLKKIAVGGGKCIGNVTSLADSCGGSTRGICLSDRTCLCHQGWVGPTCLSHHGKDPFEYDKSDDFQELGFAGPYLYVQGIAVLLFAFLTVIILVPVCQKKCSGYSRIEG